RSSDRGRSGRASGGGFQTVPTPDCVSNPPFVVGASPAHTGRHPRLLQCLLIAVQKRNQLGQTGIGAGLARKRRQHKRRIEALPRDRLGETKLAQSVGTVNTSET